MNARRKLFNNVGSYAVYIVVMVLFSLFSIYIYKSHLQHEVIDIITPTRVVVDLNSNKIADNNEIFCINNIESFSLTPDRNFIDNAALNLKISETDIISLGYLAQEFSINTLINKKVQVKNQIRLKEDCLSADLYTTDGINYSTKLLNSGFGLRDYKVVNNEKYTANLKNARKLDLVILNHKSNKYHKLDCEYGQIAHDTIVIPRKQLPKRAVPCNYCHKINKALKKKHSKTSYLNVNSKILPSPPLKHSSGDITLYYTDFTRHLKPDNLCQTNECRAFVNLVNGAKSSIDIAIYGYEEVPMVTNALKTAKNRGVDIRFVYDTDSVRGTFYPHNDIIKTLSIASNSDLGKENGFIMHNKFIIFDKETVFTGSMNFSRTGLSGYDENDVIIINSKDVAQLYEQEFEQMLNGKFHNSKISITQNNRFKIGDTELEVYFSPKDKSAKRVIELINGACNYIYIPTFLITHKDITNALIQAHNRGIDIKIIMDANAVNTRNIKYKELRAVGIPLKFENYAGKLHSKTMIIDNEYILMGSMNFSNSGENKNDENMLVIKNPQLACNYKEFFNYLWSVIPDKYLKFNPKPESFDSIGSCTDGIDNNFNGLTDSQESTCKLSK